MDEQTASPRKQPPKSLIALLALLAVGAVGVLWTTPPKKKLPPDPAESRSSHYGYSRPQAAPESPPKTSAAAPHTGPVPSVSPKEIPPSAAPPATHGAPVQPSAKATIPNKDALKKNAQVFTQAYLQSIYADVYKHWLPAPSQTPYHAAIQFTIHQNGEVSKVHITQSSGIPAVDVSMSKAVEAAAPFKPLPPEFGLKVLTVKVSFDYDYPKASQP